MRHVYLVSAAFQGEYEVGFANGLFRNGVAVTVIGSNASLVDRLDDGIRFLNLRKDQNPNRSIPRKFANIARYFVALGYTARVDRNAIFHSNGIFALRQGLGVLFEALWCRLIFREWWLTVHNLLPHDEDTWVNRLSNTIAYKLPNKLFVHTKATADAVCKQFDIDPQRVHIIEHGIDRFIEIDSKSKLRIRQKLKLPEFKTLILLFGNILRYKGVDLLIDAVDRIELPNDTFVLIVGRTPYADYRKELNTKLSEMRNHAQIEWFDRYFEDADMPDLLSAADCMVLPYRRIEQSGVIFAAKSAGLPMIVTDVGSFKDYVDLERDILIPPSDIEALASALSLVAHRASTDDRARYIQLAKQKYSWEVTLSSYALLIKEN